MSYVSKVVTKFVAANERFLKAAFTVQQFSYERKSTFLRLDIVFVH